MSLRFACVKFDDDLIRHAWIPAFRFYTWWECWPPGWRRRRGVYMWLLWWQFHWTWLTSRRTAHEMERIENKRHGIAPSPSEDS